jgi:hypothetical protein
LNKKLYRRDKFMVRNVGDDFIKTHGPCNFTDEGRRKGKERLIERNMGWPPFIADDEERERVITEKLKGRRFDEPGMVMRFKK